GKPPGLPGAEDPAAAAGVPLCPRGGRFPGTRPGSPAVMGRMVDGGPWSTMAFFSFPLYAANSCEFLALTITTSAVIFPFVPGVQPMLANMRDRPFAGSTMRADAVP